MIEIIDNFLPEEIFSEIKNYLYSRKTPWFFIDKITQSDSSLDDYQFVHGVYGANGPTDDILFNMLKPCFDKLRVDHITRIKANLSTRTEVISRRSFHVDIPHQALNGMDKKTFVEKYRTSVYYINTNDGGTVFEESGEKVNSVANRMITFDPTLKHAGTTCTNEKSRVVINFNYKIKETEEQTRSKWSY